MQYPRTVVYQTKHSWAGSWLFPVFMFVMLYVCTARQSRHENRGAANNAHSTVGRPGRCSLSPANGSAPPSLLVSRNCRITYINMRICHAGFVVAGISSRCANANRYITVQNWRVLKITNYTVCNGRITFRKSVTTTVLFNINDTGRKRLICRHQNYNNVPYGIINNIIQQKT